MVIKFNFEAYRERLQVWTNEEAAKLGSNDALASSICKISDIRITSETIRSWRMGNIKEELKPRSLRAIAAYRQEMISQTTAWLYGESLSLPMPAIPQDTHEVRVIPSKEFLQMLETVLIPKLTHAITSAPRTYRSILGAIIRQELTQKSGSPELGFDDFAFTCNAETESERARLRDIVFKDVHPTPEELNDIRFALKDYSGREYDPSFLMQLLVE